MRNTLLFLCLLPILAIGYLNYKLYYQPSFDQVEGELINTDILHQLYFLESELKNQDAANRMQRIFPEGYIFINSLYALTWCELIKDLNSSNSIYQKGVEEIDWILQLMKSEHAKSGFQENLSLPYGAYYRGWTNYVLAKKLSIVEQSELNQDEIIQFKKTCTEIKHALSISISPYLESYDGMSWPADMVMCIASIELYNKQFDNEFGDVVEAWLRAVPNRLDEKTGLIPHRTDPVNGKVIEGAQGSSQSLMLNFLIDIDPSFAKKQYNIYKELFVDYRLGLPGIREYPKGQKGAEHIDSGPLIWNIGGAASVVGQRTTGKFEDWNLYVGLRNSIEAFGCGYTTGEKKKFVFGFMPMADAFIAWSSTIESEKNASLNISNWRGVFQIISSVVGLMFLWLALRIRKRK